ncbi:hypothetical protein N9J18_02175 [Porticoccaceae bacterium]|nr:hypothetical protein [Porticoccaceae bacterium]
MAVPETNIRYTRIETEVNEAIQAHPEIHDELIRYSWSRDSSTQGTYYVGLSHHSLCKTAITYKGFLGLGAGGFPTYGGYSIRNFRGYDWENDGVTLTNNITESSIDVDVSVDVDDLTLSFDSADSGTFYIGAVGTSSQSTAVRAGTTIYTEFTEADESEDHTHMVNFRINNYVERATQRNIGNPNNVGLIFVEIGNGYHIDTVRAKWELDNYKTVSANQNNITASIHAAVHRTGTYLGTYTNGTQKTLSVGSDGGTNRGYTAGYNYEVTPYLFAGNNTPLGSTTWSGNNSFLSDLYCQAYSPSPPQIDRASELSLNSGGYYGFTLRFYHSAATRDYTQLQIRAKYRNTFNSGRKQISAIAYS